MAESYPRHFYQCIIPGVDISTEYIHIPVLFLLHYGLLGIRSFLKKLYGVVSGHAKSLCIKASVHSIDVSDVFI